MESSFGGKKMTKKQLVEDLVPVWKKINKAVPLNRIQNQKQYWKIIKLVDRLCLLVTNQKHPLAGLLNILTILVKEYDDKYCKLPFVSGIEALKFFMKQNNIKQTELSEIASQGVISDILSGKRKLNLRQIKALSKKFQTSAAIFI